MSASLSPSATGYADVDGLHLYYETYGDESATPVVLLHGGMLSIDLSYAELIPRLARRHRVVAVELQGHGRTNDIDRPITPGNSATDVVALLDHLGIDRAHVVGHSMAAAVAVELAVSHPQRVRSLVPMSASVRPDGLHEDFGDAKKLMNSDLIPTAQDMADLRANYERLSPHPEHFEDFLATLSTSSADLQGWSDDQLASITAPVLLVLGDRDFTTVEHGALMQRLIPAAQLAVLPGTKHMQVTHVVHLLDPMLADFLD